MNKYYYDLHIHSCLSPCGDDDNTPNNIAGMATLCGLNIVALTDHNTTKNCPAFFTACKKYGIIPIAGCEITTAEDVHIIALFPTLESAMDFDSELEKHRIKIKNRPDIFGNQFILDGEDNIIGTDEFLLSNATDLSIDDVWKIVPKFNGICYPAHIDRPSNGIIAVLGAFPETPPFKCVEINNKENIDEYKEKYLLEDKKIIVSSDAHILTSMRDKENYFYLDDEPYTSSNVRNRLFEYLR